MTETTAILLDRMHATIENALSEPGVIAFNAPFLACAGQIEGHTDAAFFPEWSAFLCLRNDGCTVWERRRWRGTPAVGEYFTVNIHEQHGVRSPRKRNVLAVICADGRTERAAINKLYRTIRSELREAKNGN